MRAREMEQLLRARLHEEEAIRRAARQRFGAPKLWPSGTRAVEPKPAVRPAGRRWWQGKQKPSAPVRDRRSDITLALLGITLGLICALFPWYIFFNQEKFGIRAMKFAGNSGTMDQTIVLGNQPERVGAPLTVDDIPTMNLDFLATGTVKSGVEDEDGQEVPDLAEQPFPAEEPLFRLIHVANGRAMIEDDAGLFVVQRGSRLPDNSRVAAIEQRAGNWVLVTSNERVIPLGE